jgi:poly-gamma-glutamate capsule biosynthesis protein CapA/YwtB (metallophosphatase superfamily)
MPAASESPRLHRRRLAAISRPRLLAALAIAAAAAATAVLIVRGGGGGSRSPLPPKEHVRAQHQGRHRPVHFTVSASGDLLIHAPVWERALALGGGSRYDFAAELNEVRPYVAKADLGICHLETPMTPAPPRSYPIFNTPPALAGGIAATGWDVCDTASNHSLDQGQTGIDDTGNALDAAGVRHTGSFASAVAQRKPVIVAVHGVKVALLAYTTDTNGIPPPSPWSVNVASASRVLADARRAHEMGADAVLVNLHWGGEIVPEYQQQPSSGQLALVKRLLASPLITAIVGQGPHAVQPIQRIGPKFAVFSEGNLISNQSPAAGLPAASQDGMVVLLDCVARAGEVRVKDVRYVPVFVSHPDYEVLPVGDALRKGEGDPTLLRDSYERTVGIIGESKRIEPVPRQPPK